jgi:hypothetical protein
MLGCVALLAAAQAGRPGEDGSGAMWIAPELIELIPLESRTENCALREGSPGQELVFEVIRLDERPDTARFVGDIRRPVAFEWNARTGELSIAGSAGKGMFRDVRGVPVGATALPARSCGSRTGRSATPVR